MNTMHTYRLGKRGARHDERDLLLENYLGDRGLPIPPASFGHEKFVSNWGMLGNDSLGDCVEAGACHETMLWTAEAGTQAQFTDQNAIAAYSAIAGYDPRDPSTDQGTDVRSALSYRRNTGIADANGRIHKIGAYVALEPGNWDHVRTAMYLFSGVAIGFRFPSSAWRQFDQGRPWSVVATSPIEGGHYVPCVAVRSRRVVCVTWGRLQQMTRSFLQTYCDEMWAILSPEFLKSGVSSEGFNLNQLNADLAALAA